MVLLTESGTLDELKINKGEDSKIIGQPDSKALYCQYLIDNEKLVPVEFH